MAMVVSWACPSHFWTRLRGMPAKTAATPKPWRSPLGEACGSSRPGAAMDGARRTPAGRDGVTDTPAGRARPGPEADADAAALATTRLQLADAVHQVKRIEQGR